MLCIKRACLVKKISLLLQMNIFYYNLSFILQALSEKGSLHGVNSLPVSEVKGVRTEDCVHSPVTSLSISVGHKSSRQTTQSGCDRSKEDLECIVEYLEKELHSSSKASLIEYVRDILKEEVMSSCNSSTDVKSDKVCLTLQLQHVILDLFCFSISTFWVF